MVPQPDAALCRNVVVYGAEATGKSTVTSAVLHKIAHQSAADAPPYSYAIVDSKEYITARHLFESIVDRVATAVGEFDASRRCETVSQLVVRLGQLLGGNQLAASHFVLALDSIDCQREAPATLLPALARLSETVCLIRPPQSSLTRADTEFLHLFRSQT
jgi:origin recognition complex subunit 5